MSFRSALLSPSPSSGGVGTVISGLNTFTTVFITTQPQVTSSVTLSKGLWQIAMIAKIYIPTSSVVTAYQANMIVGGVTLATDQKYTVATLTSTGDDYLEGQVFSIPVNITADGTVVQLQQQLNYAGGTGIVSMTVDGTLGAIYCVKIA